MAPHSSPLAWKIPWMEEPGGLQSTGSLRVRHDWATSLSLFTFMHWRRKWQPTPVFLPGESQGRGAWWAAIYGVAQSRTRLKQLSSSSILPAAVPSWLRFWVMEKGMSKASQGGRRSQANGVQLLPACTRIVWACYVKDIFLATPGSRRASFEYGI